MARATIAAISIYVHPDLKEAIDKTAKLWGWSVSYMIQAFMKEAVHSMAEWEQEHPDRRKGGVEELDAAFQHKGFQQWGPHQLFKDPEPQPELSDSDLHKAALREIIEE